MVLLELTMSPFDKGESVSAYVAKVLINIDESGLAYQLTPMGTIIEGDWDEVMNLVTSCFKILEADCKRISINMRIDYRFGKESRMKSKIHKVESIVGKKLKT